MEDFKIRTNNELAAYDQAFNTAMMGILRDTTVAVTNEQLVLNAHTIAILAVQKRREVVD
jgi:hypothetical protein